MRATDLEEDPARWSYDESRYCRHPHQAGGSAALQLKGQGPYEVLPPPTPPTPAKTYTRRKVAYCYLARNVDRFSLARFRERLHGELNAVAAT